MPYTHTTCDCPHLPAQFGAETHLPHGTHMALHTHTLHTHTPHAPGLAPHTATHHWHTPPTTHHTHTAHLPCTAASLQGWPRTATTCLDLRLPCPGPTDPPCCPTLDNTWTSDLHKLTPPPLRHLLYSLRSLTFPTPPGGVLQAWVGVTPALTCWHAPHTHARWVTHLTHARTALPRIARLLLLPRDSQAPPPPRRHYMYGACRRHH